MRERTSEEIVRGYFAALESGDFTQVPWAEDATLYAPIGPQGPGQPIAGREAIIAFLAPVVAKFIRVEVLNILTDGEWAAGRARLFLRRPSGAELRTMNIFRIEGGHIVEQENHFDPRPLLDR
jgi:limonene-1,2-epoxide hydrolase